jgi:hypothetical protein
MVGARLAKQQNNFSISRRTEAGLTVLDTQCVSTREYAGKNSEKAMEAQQLIDSIEQDIQRMRIDEALKASLVARLDKLRRSAELDSQSAL